ncbi:MAG TPA: phosphoadenylyl-sulfate reductase [Candidatus Cybelea sp.]|nr:phosphoadenylyl-sulfate reductase [Candidatus Cybelea sp.]
MNLATALQDLQPDPASPRSVSAEPDLRETARQLDLAFAGRPVEAVLEAAITRLFPGKIALLSSFGTEAAVVLHYLAQIDRSVPVLFLETGKHFMETLMYRDILIDRFGFTDAREIKPDPADLAAQDPNGDLWSKNPDACCHIRKVLPLERALKPFDAWITGRKRFQASSRATIPLFEASTDGKIKVNPLAHWTSEMVQDAFKRLKLPQHPLFDEGYASIGCAPCTRRIEIGEDARAGRWSGLDKTECGIHLDFQI